MIRIWTKGQPENIHLESKALYRFTFNVPNIPILKDILKKNIQARVWSGDYWEYQGQKFKVQAVYNFDNEIMVDVLLVNSPGILIPVLALGLATIIGGGILINIALTKVDKLLSTSPLFNVPVIIMFIIGLMLVYWFVFKRSRS